MGDGCALPGGLRAVGAGLRRRALLLTLGAALLGLVVAGCGGTSSPPDAAAEASALGATTVDYLPGLAADVYLPTDAGDGPTPVVLLVPGGGWTTADRTGLSPLARELADAGMLVVNSTYRASSDGATFPEPVQDVVCAAGFAAARAREAGVTPGPLVVVGHSAGGHLAALTALSGESLAARSGEGAAVDCPYDPPDVDGLVGLAGVYDATAAQDAMVEFFCTAREQDADAWQAGDPVGLVRSGDAPDGLSVLLMHGDADEVVPLAQSQTFAAALQSAGVPVALQTVPGADHADLYQATVVGASVRDWIEGLATPSDA